MEKRLGSKGDSGQRFIAWNFWGLPFNPEPKEMPHIDRQPPVGRGSDDELADHRDGSPGES